MSKTPYTPVEMKLRLDPRLKSRLEKEARLATIKIGRFISTNEYVVTILSKLKVEVYRLKPAKRRKEKANG